MTSTASAKKGQSFVKLRRSEGETVRDGMSIEEFGLLNYISIQVNPHSGYWHGNFSSLAAEVNSDEARIRYLCHNLRRRGKLYFKIRQGQRRKARFYVLGMEITSHRIVTMALVEEIEASVEEDEDYSEVEVQIPKSDSPNCSRDSDADSVKNPEVSYKENKKESKKDKKNEMKIKSNAISSSTLKDTFEALCESHGAEYATQYFAKRGYPLPPSSGNGAVG